jgi:uncharacterized LabA/DUF88 family protein
MAKSVVIIVDGTNLFLSAKGCGVDVWPPDLPPLLLSHVDGDVNPVCKTHYFTSVDRTNRGQQRALNKISRSGIIVYDYDLKCYLDQNTCPSCNDKCPQCGRDLREKPHKEKMIDIAIGTKIIELAYQAHPYLYDTFIIVSGDKDLIPTIQLIRQKLGKEVIVAGFRHENPDINTLAYEIDKEVDKIINFYDIL